MRALLSIAIAAFAAQAMAQPRILVDLDRPGVLEAIERDNPDHYRKIVGILRISQVEPCETLPKVLKAQFGAGATQCDAFLLMTSLPPRRHLAFTLDDTSYVTNVVQTKLGGRIIPAK